MGGGGQGRQGRQAAVSSFMGLEAVGDYGLGQPRRAAAALPREGQAQWQGGVRWGTDSLRINRGTRRRGGRGRSSPANRVGRYILVGDGGTEEEGVESALRHPELTALGPSRGRGWGGGVIQQGKPHDQLRSSNRGRVVCWLPAASGSTLQGRIDSPSHATTSWSAQPIFAHDQQPIIGACSGHQGASPVCMAC